MNYSIVTIEATTIDCNDNVLDTYKIEIPEEDYDMYKIRSAVHEARYLVRAVYYSNRTDAKNNDCKIIITKRISTEQRKGFVLDDIEGSKYAIEEAIKAFKQKLLYGKDSELAKELFKPTLYQSNAKVY